MVRKTIGTTSTIRYTKSEIRRIHTDLSSYKATSYDVKVSFAARREIAISILRVQRVPFDAFLCYRLLLGSITSITPSRMKKSD